MGFNERKSDNMEPLKIIFDTDIGGDCDDAGTLTMLHRLCDKGEAELLAVTHCFATPWVAGCIDAINRFYGREVPVGINYSNIQADNRGVYAASLCESFPNRYPAEAFGTENGAPDTLTILRKTLADAPDMSVTLVVTGKLSSMAKLASSKPDDISDMNGIELIQKKLIRTVVMGGRFMDTWPMTIFPDGGTTGDPVTWEWNIRFSHMDDIRLACDNWPGELVYASYEIGSYIKTMVGYPDRAIKGDPVALAYDLHNHGQGRCSWDQTAMLEAIRPGRYWNYHEYGRITVGDDFVTRWEPSTTFKHTYLLPKTGYSTIRQTIDDLVDGK